MSSAYILNVSLSDEDWATVTSLLQGYGFDAVRNMPDDLAAMSAADDLAVICLPSDPSDENVLRDRAQNCVAMGIRVIGIWLHNEQSGLPSGLEHFGSATVTTASDALGAILCGETTGIWESADGSSRAAQPMPRNKC